VDGDFELMETAARLIAFVVADAASIGLTIDAVLERDTLGNMEVRARWSPDMAHISAYNGGLVFKPDSDAVFLVWLADEIQEITMERDQVNVAVWPACEIHGLGAHADVVSDVAVWSCNGGAGHVIAPIGTLAALGG
jgi:hypothetical protein